MAKNQKVTAPAQDKKETKDYSKNVWLNYVSDKMIHEQHRTDDPTRTFRSVTISCPESATGLATIAVNDGQVKPSTKKNGAPVEGFSNILLGDADKTHKVSVATDKKGKNFKDIEMTNGEICRMFEVEKAKYREGQKSKGVESLNVPTSEIQNEAQAEA